MDLVTLQREAWDCAEAKGHHVGLAQVSIANTRLLALASLAEVYAAVTAIAQAVKRHGIPENTENLSLLCDNVYGQLLLWMEQCNGEEPWPCDHTTPTAVRLTLTHTEVSEAYDATQSPAKLMEELADIVIRVAELAQCLGGNLRDAVQEKLAANWQRPYAYGTPHETAHQR